MHQKGRLRKRPAQPGGDEAANPRRAQRGDRLTCKHSSRPVPVRLRRMTSMLHWPSQLLTLTPQLSYMAPSAPSSN